MTKQTLLSLLILVLGTSLSYAQTPDGLAQISAENLCDCLTNTYSHLDEDVKVIVLEIVRHKVENRPAEELVAYGNSLPKELREKVETQSADFYSHSEEANACIKTAEDAYKTLPNDNNPENVSAAQFAELIIEKMGEDKACSYSKSLYQMDVSFRQRMNKEAQASNQEK